MTVFFTADTHFGHSNVIRYDNRPFRDVNEMNETLIENWNRVVGPADTVYHLGDVSILRPEKTREILDSLNGKICHSRLSFTFSPLNFGARGIREPQGEPRANIAIS